MCVACVEPAFTSGVWLTMCRWPSLIVCSNAWNRDSLNEIIGLIFEIRMSVPPTSFESGADLCLTSLSLLDILHNHLLGILPSSPGPVVCRKRPARAGRRWCASRSLQSPIRRRGLCPDIRPVQRERRTVPAVLRAAARPASLGHGLWCRDGREGEGHEGQRFRGDEVR